MCGRSISLLTPRVMILSETYVDDPEMSPIIFECADSLKEGNGHCLTSCEAAVDTVVGCSELGAYFV